MSTQPQQRTVPGTTSAPAGNTSTPGPTTAPAEAGNETLPAPVYLGLAPAEQAAAHVARTINTALASERGHQDLAAAFELHPVATDEVSAAGRPYRVIRWGVFIADPDYAETPAGELVSYGAVHIRRDGSLRYNPRGLHEPLTADELAQLLTQIQDSHGG